MKPRNTISNSQRLIGRKFDEPEAQADMKRFPFQVVDRRGKPAVQVQFRGETKVFAPEEVVSMILAKMKEIAETYLDSTVGGAGPNIFQLLSAPVYQGSWLNCRPQRSSSYQRVYSSRYCAWPR